MNNRDEELAKARAQMNQTPLQPPRPFEEEPVSNSIPNQPQMQSPQNMNNGGVADAMTVVDFLNAANAPQYVDKYWASKGKKVQIKKFKKGDLDKISAPLMSKTMKLDLNAAAAGSKNQTMNLDLSMGVFNEMEKIMVELGMSAYKDGRGQPVINREYIDNVMPEDDFKELSDLIREVNPKALMGGATMAQDTEDTKK
jgi:hypothetical protein